MKDAGCKKKEEGREGRLEKGYGRRIQDEGQWKKNERRRMKDAKIRRKDNGEDAEQRTKNNGRRIKEEG